MWGSTEKTNVILADIFDILQSINYNLARMGGGHPSKPKPYPRPKKDKDRKYGDKKSSLPVAKMREWVKGYGKGKK